MCIDYEWILNTFYFKKRARIANCNKNMNVVKIIAQKNEDDLSMFDAYVNFISAQKV